MDLRRKTRLFDQASVELGLTGREALTPDLGGHATTAEVTAAIIRAMG